MNIGFIDEEWPAAVKIASNRNTSECLPLFGITSISPNADWIWYQNPAELVSYCRGYLREYHLNVLLFELVPLTPYAMHRTSIGIRSSNLRLLLDVEDDITVKIIK